MKKNPQVLYLGQLFKGSTALHRMQALVNLGCRVLPVDTTLPFGYRLPNGTPRWFLRKCLERSNLIVDWKQLHAKLRRLSLNRDWDILWVDKGGHLSPKALAQFKSRHPRCCLVNYSPDDMFNPINQTRRYREGFSIYDLFVTTKTYNVKEFRQAGVKDVLFVGNAYESSIHRPVTLTREEKEKWGCDICFVGACEADRQASIEKLASSGASIGLFGPWKHLASKLDNVTCHPGFFADDNYVKALCAGKIGLGFLRKSNRDQQTTRSVELPACGVFMLAERTPEHLNLFKEGQEAEFFDSDTELIEKASFYLSHSDTRQKIAEAGRRRCLNSGYSYDRRMQTVLSHLQVST